MTLSLMDHQRKSPEELRKLLDYSSESGVLKWKYNPSKPRWWNKRFAGKIAGCKCRRYMKITIDYRCYTQHEVAWAIYYGEYCQTIIDHKDQNSFNNPILNLRGATVSQNRANSKKSKRRLPQGVYLVPSGRYAARICHLGTRLNLGTFDTLEGAKSAYDLKHKELFKEYSCL